MRRVIGLGFALGGVALACLLVGMGNGSDCATGMSSAACLGGSLGGVRTWLGLGGAAAATAIGLLGVSVIVQARRHRRLEAGLRELARPERLADHSVGIVTGLDAPYVAGLRGARIYCPPDLDWRLSESELRAVLLHERHHQASHAPARLVVLASIETLVGWLPAAMRWLEVRRAAIEIGADEHALTSGARRSDLARALLKLGSPGAESSLPSYASASELRLRHLTGKEAPPHSWPYGAIRPLVPPIAAFAACLVLGLAT